MVRAATLGGDCGYARRRPKLDRTSFAVLSGRCRTATPRPISRWPEPFWRSAAPRGDRGAPPAIDGGVDGSTTYASRTELHEAMAEAIEQAGQRDSALVHYRTVEQAWRQQRIGLPFLAMSRPSR